MKNKAKATAKENAHSFRNYLFMLKFVMKNSPMLMISLLVFDVLSTLPWILSNVVLLKYIIDVVTQGTGLYRIAVACIIFAAVVVIGNLGNTVFYEIYRPKQMEKLQRLQNLWQLCNLVLKKVLKLLLQLKVKMKMLLSQK